MKRFFLSMNPEHRVYSVLGAALLAVVIWCAVEFALTERETRADVGRITAAAESLSNPKTGVAPTVTAAVVDELGKWRVAADGQLTSIVKSANRTEGDATATAARALAIVEGLADPKTGIAATLDARAQAIEGDLTGQLTRANGTLETALNGPAGVIPAAASFLATYQALPHQLYSTPEADAFRLEWLCQRPDGTGYGDCMRGRIRGLLGEALKTGAAITVNAKPLTDAITGIAVDTHTFTTKIVSPCVKPTRKGASKVIAQVGCGAKDVIHFGGAAGEAYAAATR